jgi:hypothetical protein
MPRSASPSAVTSWCAHAQQSLGFSLRDALVCGVACVSRWRNASQAARAHLHLELEESQSSQSSQSASGLGAASQPRRPRSAHRPAGACGDAPGGSGLRRLKHTCTHAARGCSARRRAAGAAFV